MAVFREQDHPRDSDGRFIDKGTPAEEKRLNEVFKPTQLKDRNSHAISFKNKGVKHVLLHDIPDDYVDVIAKALDTLPKRAVPKFVCSFASFKKAVDSSFKGTGQYAVTTEIYTPIDLRGFGGEIDLTINENMNAIAFNTREYKSLNDLTKRKEWANERFKQRYGRDYFINTSGESTIYHEIGHLFEKEFGIPSEFKLALHKWRKEDNAKRLEDENEAFAEAWAGVFTNNSRVPNYVKDVILKQTKG